jgi:hypothetical protein
MTVGPSGNIQIVLNNITPVDSTDYFTFIVQTGISPGSIATLGTNPKILVHGSPRPIAQIKINNAQGLPLLNGKYVTAEGIVTAADEFNSPSYIQDSTAGMAVYSSSFSSTVHEGDQVIVLGFVSPYDGLFEIDSVSLLQTVSTGNAVTPQVLTCSQIANEGAGGVEPYEGSLVRVNTATVNTSTWASGDTYNLTDASGTAQLYVNKHVNFVGALAPQSAFDVIGVVGQYKTSSPYTSGYQLTPRSSSDIITSTSGPLFATVPVESNLAPTSLTVSWTTVNNGTTRLRYGITTAYELGVLAPNNTLGTSHSVSVTGLTAATIYHMQAFSVDINSDTSTAHDLVVSTSSPPQCTGKMNVYFNFSVNTSVSLGENAQGNVNFIPIILSHINNATHSIDAALYSLTGSSEGDLIADALIAAQNRGVRVRVICETTNSSESGFTILQGGGVPLINETFDPTWNGQGIMHNKFFVIDYVGGAPDSVWVWGGSYNPTVEGTTEDRQNVLEIQDVALAGAYTLEFNQMWGSNTVTPNSAFSKFGSDKSDITPHNFLINGTPVSVYFSPSDQTTSHIAATMSGVHYSLSGCMYTFTRSDLADTLVVKKNAGKGVREVIDNSTTTDDQYSYLVSSGVDVHLKGFSSPALLHHKYEIVDGDHSAGTPYLLTGSHDWTNAAEEYNDENEEIVQSSRIANLYLQEFAARYYEAGGTDTIHAVNDANPVAVCALNRSSINFDTVFVNSSKQDSFIVSNNGTITLTISSVTSNNAIYTVTPTSVSVGAGNTQKFYVTFSPTAVGADTAKITLLHNAASSPDSVVLYGFGGLPAFSANYNALNFDTVFVGRAEQDSFTVSNTGSEPLIISSVVSSDTQFAVMPGGATISPSGSLTFKVTFTPKDTGNQSASIVLSNNAAGGSDTVVAQGIGKLKVISFSAVTGWNLISLPLVLPDGQQVTVFPRATSMPFAYSGRYVASDSLVPNEGYWLKFAAAEVDTFAGTPLVTDTIAVDAKWNIIGAITYPVPADSVRENPPGNIVSNYYGYNGAYYPADTLYPGNGYWAKANASGTLILSGNSSSKAAPKSARKTATAQANRLVFTDAAGHTQTLSLEEQKGDKVSTARYELPPVPPAGAFDVRFNSDQLVEFYNKNLTSTTEFPIVMQGVKFPVTVRWTLCADSSVTVALKVFDGKTSTTKIANKGSVSLSASSSALFSLTVSPIVAVPASYSLAQNYPNPFNPTTTLSFGLPARSAVKLIVFNTLGEVVATLVNELEDAGFHSVTWQPNVSSGVYFYRIEAVDVVKAAKAFTKTGKMVLMK